MRTITNTSVLGSISAIFLLLACSSSGTTPGTTAGTTPDTTTPPHVTPDGPATTVVTGDAVPEALQQSLARAKAMDGASLQSAYPPPAATPLTYDPTTAVGIDLIAASPLALNANELSTLGQNGFVISKRQQFPSFAYGYKSIYSADLPVYVSADSILEAVHRTFDALLKRTEELSLVPSLSTLLNGMRSRLQGSTFDSAIAKDADLYLTVAASLLGGQQLPPQQSDNAAGVATLYAAATAASGHQTTQLFGVTREEDFSQFEPRGHYTDSDTLKQYFRAMMWLGRVDLRLIETQSDGSQTFYRRQFDAAVALRELLGDAEYTLWNQIDSTIGAYTGEHDSMTPKDMDGLLAALKVTSLASASALSDAQIVDEIARGGWGAQRIASRIIINNAGGATLPLDRSFLLFGQRYTVDSNVFVNVTFDRVAERLMPRPLDVAFAALGNNAALPLLSGEFANTSYVQGLAKSRSLVDAHEDAYWEGSLYTRWLGALRGLSPNGNAVQPSVTKTAAWQQRMLATQLGSWAELRHDTILYAKQSYTAGVLCQFPDAYVDPYPEFYGKLGAFAEAVGQVTQALPESASDLKTKASTWVTNFKGVAANLQKMAEDQVSGTPHSAELLAFINDAVNWDEQTICGGAIRSNFSGWYRKLYLNDQGGIDYDPVVADVHTQPTDAAGKDVGRVLHVGTGMPRLMVVTVDTCQGPRAYAGLAFSYGERITEKWKRLNDQQWEQDIQSGFPDPDWVLPVLAN